MTSLTKTIAAAARVKAAHAREWERVDQAFAGDALAAFGGALDQRLTTLRVQVIERVSHAVERAATASTAETPQHAAWRADTAYINGRLAVFDSGGAGGSALRASIAALIKPEPNFDGGGLAATNELAAAILEAALFFSA